MICDIYHTILYIYIMILYVLVVLDIPRYWICVVRGAVNSFVVWVLYVNQLHCDVVLKCGSTVRHVPNACRKRGNHLATPASDSLLLSRSHPLVLQPFLSLDFCTNSEKLENSAAESLCHSLHVSTCGKFVSKWGV